MRAFELLNEVQGMCDKDSPAFGLYKRVFVMTPDGPARISAIVNHGGTLFIQTEPCKEES